MTGRRGHPRDERGISTVVSHVMSVAITTLLIISLVATVTGFLDGHQERAATNELETIGNRLSAELTKADSLARYSDGVNVTTALPDSVAGSPYTVVLAHGSCGGVPTDTCVKLRADEYRVSALVPVRNSTELHLESGAGGRFVITSAGTTGSPAADRRRVELSPRVGIGQDVGTGPNFGPGTSLSRAPIPKFSIRPAIPETNEPVTFDASGSTDPDGSISTYEWDFDDDGAFEVTTSSPTTDHSFSTAGTHNVTLAVTDNSGQTTERSREIDVSGLEYGGDLEAVSAANPNGLTFTVTNEHAEQVTIERLLIDPANDLQDEVAEDRPAGASDEEFVDPHEIEIDRGDDGSIDGFVDWDADGWGADPLEVPPDGAIVDINRDGHYQGGDVVLAPGDTARITIQDFPATTIGESFTFGVRYRIAGGTNANVFEGTVDPP